MSGLTPLLVIAALGAVAFKFKGGSSLELALQIIRDFEGFSPKKYRDSQGWSIGYGHFIRATEPWLLTATISRDEAEALLVADVQAFAAVVDKAVKVKISEKARASLISFAYNVGEGAFKSSTLLSLVNQGKQDEAAKQFDRWVYDTASGKPVVIPALVTRRAAEKSLFLA